MFRQIVIYFLLAIVLIFIDNAYCQDGKSLKFLNTNCNEAFEALKNIKVREKIEESIVGPIPEKWQIVEKTREKSGVSSNPPSDILDVFKIISRKNELKDDKYYKATWDKKEGESILSTWFTKGGGHSLFPSSMYSSMNEGCLFPLLHTWQFLLVHGLWTRAIDPLATGQYFSTSSRNFILLSFIIFLLPFW